jgi:hypothetical protein
VIKKNSQANKQTLLLPQFRYQNLLINTTTILLLHD